MIRFIKFIFIVFLSLILTRLVYAAEYTGGVSLSLSEEYNDNIFLDNEDRKSDFITYISPGIDLSARTPRSDIGLSYSTSFSFYRSYSELNEPSHRLTARGSFTLSERASLSIADTFVKSEEIRDIRSVPELGPLTERIELITNSVTGNFSYRLTNNFSYSIGTSYFMVDSKDPDYDEVKTYSGSFGFSYTPSERTTYSVSARYAKYDYKTSSDAHEQDYSLGFVHRLNPTLTLGVTGSVIITNIEDNGESDTGYGGAINLTKTFERGSLAVFYSRTIIPALESRSPVLSQTVGLNLSRNITNRVDASAGISFSKFESVLTDEMDTDQLGVNFSLVYTLRQWASLLVLYSFIDSDDKIDNTRDYYNHIAMLTLRLSYTKRL